MIKKKCVMEFLKDYLRFNKIFLISHYVKLYLMYKHQYKRNIKDGKGKHYEETPVWGPKNILVNTHTYLRPGFDSM